MPDLAGKTGRGCSLEPAAEFGLSAQTARGSARPSAAASRRLHTAVFPSGPPPAASRWKNSLSRNGSCVPLRGRNHRSIPLGRKAHSAATFRGMGVGRPRRYSSAGKAQGGSRAFTSEDIRAARSQRPDLRTPSAPFGPLAKATRLTGFPESRARCRRRNLLRSNL